MKQSLQASEENALLIERDFDAPRALLFKVWTDPFHLARWWTPYGFDAKVLAMDVRPGGTFHIELTSPDGQVFPSRGVFQEIIEAEKIVLKGDSAAPDPCGAGLPPGAVITVTFTENNGITSLSLHTQFEAADKKQAASAGGFNAGWASALESLTRYLINFKAG